MERTILRGCVALLLMVVLALLLSPARLQASEAPDGSAGAVAAGPDEEGDEDEDAFMEDLLNESTDAGQPAAAQAADAGQRFPLRHEGELLGSLWAPNARGDGWHTTNRLDVKGWGAIGAVGISGRLRVNYQDLEEAPRTRGDLRELYATWQLRSATGGYTDIAIGKKILYWGKGDEVRPIDRACPEDLTTLYFTNLNDRKSGRAGVFVDTRFNGSIRLEGFWSPYFQSGITPGAGDYFQPALLGRIVDAGIGIDDDAAPDAWSTDAAFGARLMVTLLKADISLYAFQGYDPKPTYGVGRRGPDPYYGLPIVPLSVRATYPRMTLYGADIERSVGTVVLRAEAAYQTDGAWYALDWSDDLTLLLETPDGNVEKDQLQYVVGMDKSDLFIRNLFLNLQFLGSHIFDHDPRMVSAASQTGMTAYARYTCMDSKLELWYRYMILFHDTNQRHQCEIGYKPLAWAQTSIGAVAYDGETDTSTFGQYADRDFIYAKLKLIF